MNSFTFFHSLLFCLIYFQAEKSLDFQLLADFCIKILYAYGILSVYCEIGEQLGTKFDELGDALYQCEFEALPIDVQRTIPIILSFMQNSPALAAYGNLKCSRETFKRVRILFKFTIWLKYFIVWMNFDLKILLCYIFRFPKMATHFVRFFVHFIEFVSKLNKNLMLIFVCLFVLICVFAKRHSNNRFQKKKKKNLTFIFNNWSKLCSLKTKMIINWLC